ncbi:hypothetical protein EKPJFOCH_1003 [Methylobacterium thuringiense]|uniref:MarR family transcriptional regulator n=1 Tax=Methylobacterium thuringiense TaxID=1003091 RepID=A0ABQ4TKG5_9HYPH|nr:hypothetical protein EKPJFOCH_1003 [Methylobacterium thuringiense]
MLSENHRRILVALDGCHDDFGDPGFLSFDGIARRGEIDRSLVRRNVRHLARKGLTKYARGLWTDDGPAGAGYAITPAGRSALTPEQEGRDGHG